VDGEVCNTNGDGCLGRRLIAGQKAENKKEVLSYKPDRKPGWPTEILE